MKIEKIEINRIKVTLSALDLIDMNVSVKSLTPSSPKLNSFLHEVMEKVKEETGFNPYTGQVMVEATPENDGVVLIVTKLSEEPLFKKRPKRIRVTGHRSAQKITYKFASFQDVCELFSCCDPQKFNRASLYEYMENFYITIPKGAIAAIREFGESGNTILLGERFLAEHGKLHASGESLISMAEGVKELMKGS